MFIYLFCIITIISNWPSHVKIKMWSQDQDQMWSWKQNWDHSSSDISGSIIITRLKIEIVISWSRGALIVIIGIESNSNLINDYTCKFATISYVSLINTPLVIWQLHHVGSSFSLTHYLFLFFSFFLLEKNIIHCLDEW